MTNNELNLIMSFAMGALTATAVIAIIALIVEGKEAKLLERMRHLEQQMHERYTKE
jgi:hypothetical protein